VLQDDRAAPYSRSVAVPAASEAATGSIVTLSSPSTRTWSRKRRTVPGLGSNASTRPVGPTKRDMARV
jgi:hypothetical protein